MNLKEIFSHYAFHPVIHLPKVLPVFDFTKGYDPNRMLSSQYGIGRYNEKRVGMYTSELFTKDAAKIRDIHMGIDIAAPAGTAVHVFFDGTIFCATINEAAGDYGGTIITEHKLGEQKLWVLHGHLSHASIVSMSKNLQAGKGIQKGEVIAYLGDQTENGGWNPHLHFQISLQAPIVCDMPGAVNIANLDEALKQYPDPRLILGNVY